MSDKSQGEADLSRQLLDLVHAMSLAADLDALIAALLQGGADLLACDGMAAMWLDEDHLEVLGSRGPTSALPGLILPASQIGAARPAVEGGRPVVVDDTAEDARWQRVPGEEQARSWLGVPLVVEGRAVGLLEWTDRMPQRFAEADVEMALEMARYAAPLLHRMRLLDDMRRRLHERTRLQAGLDEPVVDLAEELSPLVSEARELTGARHAFAFVMEEGGRFLCCAAASGELRESLKSTILHGDGTLDAWSQPIVSARRRRGAHPSDREKLASLGIRKTQILPLRVKGQAVGLLGVGERRGGGEFDGDALRVMMHLASQASVILERAHQSRPEPEQYDYEGVVQSAPLGVGVLTLTGDIRFCNPGMAELLSRSTRTLTGRNLSEFLVSADRRRLSHVLEEAAVSAQRMQVDLRLRSAGDEQRHVRLWLAPARADAAREAPLLAGLVAIMEDVTSLKILEEERVEYLRELREKHNQLRELDQLKSRFVANVSHELRTPLAVIKLYATLARRGRPDKKDHYLQTIEQETFRLETLVENILDLTRLDAQSLQMHPEWLAPAEVIAHVLELYGEAAQKKGILLRNETSGPLPSLWADKSHLVQMLTNLVDNALKYTARGGQVWVAARLTELEGKPALEISVSDTGTGISEAEQEKVFDRFYRGANNPAGVTGTGLGLAIVQELMAQHGGRVVLTSQVGEGSVFALQFPLGDRAGRRSFPANEDERV